MGPEDRGTEGEQRKAKRRREGERKGKKGHGRRRESQSEGGNSACFAP